MIILTALWFFLPAGIANMGPVLANQIPFISRWNAPMDFGKSYRGKRIFGDHKTWRGLLSGALLATVIVILQKYLYTRYAWVADISWLDYRTANAWIVGPLLGLGALLGDAIESFFKRQHGIAPGKSWFPFDQIDFVAGGLLLSAPVAKPSIGLAVTVFLTFAGLHPLFVYIGYILGFRKKADLQIF